MAPWTDCKIDFSDQDILKEYDVDFIQCLDYATNFQMVYVDASHHGDAGFYFITVFKMGFRNY